MPPPRGHHPSPRRVASLDRKSGICLTSIPCLAATGLLDRKTPSRTRTIDRWLARGAAIALFDQS